jgi:hypothetical protein
VIIQKVVFHQSKQLKTNVSVVALRLQQPDETSCLALLCRTIKQVSSSVIDQPKLPDTVRVRRRLNVKSDRIIAAKLYKERIKYAFNVARIPESKNVGLNSTLALFTALSLEALMEITTNSLLPLNSKKQHGMRHPVAINDSDHI